MCKVILITGKVQGVGFRAFLEDMALQLGLKGYVRNVDNDKVESVVCGEPELIALYISACKMGPRRAIIENVDIKDYAFQTKFEGFSIWL